MALELIANSFSDFRNVSYCLKDFEYRTSSRHLAVHIPSSCETRHSVLNLGLELQDSQ